MAYTEETLSLVQDITADDEKQLVDILTPVLFGESLFNRKDAYTLKLNIYTGGDVLNVLIYTSYQTDPVYVGYVTTAELTECFFNLSEIIGITKWFQVRLVGLLADFKCSGFVIDYENHPQPVSSFKVALADLGPNKKRVRVWPITLDTLGEDAVLTPYVDNIAQPVLTMNSTYPKTFFYQFLTDVFGVDYGYKVLSNCSFEIYKAHEPSEVQILPIAKRFDQVGSEEFFRYGKLKLLLLRVLPIGGTVIPYAVYVSDELITSGEVTVVDSVEDTYEIKMPKTVAGTVIRIVLGPTVFDFHRFYIHVLTSKSGRDTDIEWVTLK